MDIDEKNRYVKFVVAFQTLIDADEPAIALGLLEGAYERLAEYLFDGLDDSRKTILQIIKRMHDK